MSHSVLIALLFLEQMVEESATSQCQLPEMCILNAFCGETDMSSLASYDPSLLSTDPRGPKEA